MKVTLESTDRIVELEGPVGRVQARVWVGRTEKGVECHAFIPRIAVGNDEDASEFAASLTEMPQAHAPLPEHLATAIPLRLVL